LFFFYVSDVIVLKDSQGPFGGQELYPWTVKSLFSDFTSLRSFSSSL